MPKMIFLGGILKTNNILNRTIQKKSFKYGINLDGKDDAIWEVTLKKPTFYVKDTEEKKMIKLTSEFLQTPSGLNSTDDILGVNIKPLPYKPLSIEQ